MPTYHRLPSYFSKMVLFITLYWIFGFILVSSIFGYKYVLHVLLVSPVSAEPLSGLNVLVSSLLASILIFKWMSHKLASQPYPYFMLGFYVGNASVFLIIFLMGFLNNLIIWKFPEVLLMFLAPLVGLLTSYILGIIFLALLPAWLSAYILYKINHRFQAK